MADKAQVVTGSSLDILAKLRGMRRDVVDQMSAITDDPNLIMRCDVLLAAYDDLYGDSTKLSPRIEQMKGVAKGLQLAVPVVLQHTEILKGTYAKDGDKEKLKLCLEVVMNCRDSITGTLTQQREELVRAMGKFDGSVTSATSLLNKISGFLENAKGSREAEKLIRENPFAEDRVKDPPKTASSSNGKAKKRSLGAKREAASRKRGRSTHDGHN